MTRQARLIPPLVAHAEALLRELLRFEQPADAVVSRYCRQYHELGQADRGFLSETVFAVLRRKRSLEACCGAAPTPRRLLLAALACVRGCNLRELAPVLKESETEWLAQVKAVKMEDLPPAVRHDFPDWLETALVAQLGEAETEALAQALAQPAPLDVRINPLKISRDAALARLTESGIEARAGLFSPLALRLAGKPALSGHPLFVEGSIEIQDEGSQLLALLLAPRRGEMVVDFCAGAGGKTLLLGALMHNSGRLYAFDVSDQRLAKLKPRLARSGLSNVHPVRIEHERDSRVKRLAGKIDRVLVDAPCSGLGTLRRAPDLKWRQDEAAITGLQAKQTAILSAAASLVKKGGRLVYATCSMLAAENDDVVDAFLAAHPHFALVPAEDVLARQGIALPGERLRLGPHRHHTDGFFAAVLEHV